MMAVYISPIPGVDLGTFFVLVFAFLMLHDKRKKTYKLPKSLLILLVYTFLTTVIGLTGYMYSEPISILLRLFKYLLVLIIMIGVGFPTYFEEGVFMNYLRKASFIVVGYAMVQSLFYFFTGVNLPGTFGPTKVDYTPDESAVAAVSSALDYFYRPTSFFYEPSHAAYFMCPYLCYLLFINKDLSDKKIRNAAIFMSLGILVTTSGQGLVSLVACWGIWTLKELKKFNVKAIILLVLAITFIIVNFDVYKIVERVITTDEYSGIDARKGGYDIMKETSIYKLILGFGYGNYDQTIYYSSLAEIITCTGIVGLILVINMYLRIYLKGIKFQKVLVIVSFLLMAGGGVYTTCYLCQYLPLLFYNRWNCNEKYSKTNRLE